MIASQSPASTNFDGSIQLVEYRPRVLEHLVDTVLAFDGERHHALRMLRAVKHRFGSTHELGLFEMGELGLVGVPDPSALFLADRQPGVPGSVVAPVLDGQRPLLVEVQALVGPSNAPSPRRTAQGVDGGRLAQDRVRSDGATGQGVGEVAAVERGEGSDLVEAHRSAVSRPRRHPAGGGVLSDGGGEALLGGRLSATLGVSVAQLSIIINTNIATWLTPGRRSTAVRTLAAQDPQSMPVTVHSQLVCSTVVIFPFRAKLAALASIKSEPNVSSS